MQKIPSRASPPFCCQTGADNKHILSNIQRAVGACGGYGVPPERGSGGMNIMCAMIMNCRRIRVCHINFPSSCFGGTSVVQFEILSGEGRCGAMVLLIFQIFCSIMEIEKAGETHE
jgi:hypothetical protein